MVSLPITTDPIVDGRTARAKHLITPLNQLKTHQENMLNGVQAFDGVKVGGTLSASAIMELTSTTKGFLPPRMTTAERDAISNPANGSLIYNTTTNAYNFYNGSSWLALSTAAGIDEASCRVTKSTNQTIGATSDAIISWDTESYDTDSMHDNVTNNSRITATTAGRYFITTTIKLTNGIPSYLRAVILLNGATIIAGNVINSLGSAIPYINVSTLYNLSAGQYVEVQVSNGGATPEDVDTVTSHFAVSKQLE
jgi:hypothetical protein